jgi:hypothetical protein
MSRLLILADISCLLSDEAYIQHLSLPSYRFIDTLLPVQAQSMAFFSTKFSLKRDSAAGKYVCSVTLHL